MAPDNGLLKMSQDEILKGNVLTFIRPPFEGDPTDAVRVEDAVLISNGRIVSTGPAVDLQEQSPQALVTRNRHHCG